MSPRVVMVLLPLIAAGCELEMSSQPPAAPKETASSATESNSPVLVVTEQNFQSEVLNSQEPVLVDFWAPWCGPCRTMSPIIEQLAVEFQGKAKVAQVNVDDNRALAKEYGIRSIPRFLVFHKGEVVDIRPA